MQYAACMHDDLVWHDGCAAADEPRVMGCDMNPTDPTKSPRTDPTVPTVPTVPTGPTVPRN